MFKAAGCRRERVLKKLKSKVIYHGGTIPVPSYFQKGALELRDSLVHFQARGESEKHAVDIRIPLRNLKRVTAEEKKYYSSTGYFLIIQYADAADAQQELELEIRCFGRRGTAQAVARLWAQTLSEHIQPA
jgi:hypothetical protein